MRTPLGPLAGSRALADIPTTDRLAELEFELPLLGGDEPTAGKATLLSLAERLRSHLDPHDPLAAYPDRLSDPALAGQTLRGYLTGGIDAVLRVWDAADAPRYLVVDYKTNWLGQFDPSGAMPLTAWDYRPAALASAMINAHYPLQALLYSVALHRYLRWRQPGYDPAVHLGGVLYLFVRGMCGPDTPVVDGVPTGVFSWRPAPQLVEDLSALLDRGEP
jgi:exodeoxyribonuclease V beta subunit